VPTPTPSIVTAIHTILKAHNPIEEGPGGLYEQCEALASAETDQVLNALRNAAQVRVAPHINTANVIEATHEKQIEISWRLSPARFVFVPA
jgi:hypothetical protein